MVSLSQSTGYGVLALSRFDPTGEKLVQLADIAAEANIPKPYLVKILAKVQAAGLIEAKRGQGGGMRLARPAEKISIFDLVRAIDGSDWDDRCLLGLPTCSGANPCPVHAFWSRVKPEIERTLRDLTLDKLRPYAEAGWKFSLPTPVSLEGTV